VRRCDRTCGHGTPAGATSVKGFASLLRRFLFPAKGGIPRDGAAAWSQAAGAVRSLYTTKLTAWPRKSGLPMRSRGQMPEESEQPGSANDAPLPIGPSSGPPILSIVVVRGGGRCIWALHSFWFGCRQHSGIRHEAHHRVVGFVPAVRPYAPARYGSRKVV
jgi:hypothetical protein